MSISFKAQAVMRDLTARLQLKLPTLIFTSSVDALGARLQISQSATPTTEQQNFAIRIAADTTAFTDVLGNPQTVFVPLKAQVIEEALTGNPTISCVSLINRLAVDLELARMGVKQERWLNAAGTPATVAQFTVTAGSPTVTGSALIASIPFDMYWPLSGQ